MKQTLFLLYFLPLQFFSQIQTDGLLPKNVTQSGKIKSVRATTVFITSHVSDKPDTGIVDLEEYDQNGNIIRGNYSNMLDKNNYKSRSEYFYKSGDQQRLVVHYENGSISDSILIISPSYYIHYFLGQKKQIIHEIKDSVLTETAIMGTDTTVHKHKTGIAKQDIYAADFYPGFYEREILIHDSIHNIDSCIFLDKKGDNILTIINKYDSYNHLVESDYYNRKDRNYRIYTSRYNARMNMIFYMPVRKVERTYQIIRVYNNLGLVSKETRISSSKRDPTITTYYEYSYYK